MRFSSDSGQLPSPITIGYVHDASMIIAYLSFSGFGVEQPFCRCPYVPLRPEEVPCTKPVLVSSSQPRDERVCVAQAVSRESRIPWMGHSGFNLLLVRHLTETAMLTRREMEPLDAHVRRYVDTGCCGSLHKPRYRRYVGQVPSKATCRT